MKKADFNNMILSESSPRAMVEAYNTLRTNLCYALPGEGAKVVALTAAKHAQGVSTSAVNLSISLSQIGKKVLLIDADMHSALVSEKLGLKDKAGLSDCLRGAALKDNICSQKGIDLLPAGSACPNPANLLDSAAMEKLLSEAKTVYEFIILSLPPVGLVSDAAIVAKYADGFLPLVSHDSTRYREVGNMLRSLRIADSNILGFIYNYAPENK